MKQFAAGTTGLLIVAVLAAVAAFTWGGASLVSTRGISMEPGFRTGDLAVLRPASEYSVGDVASYRSEELNTVVMHRIVAIEDGRYTFQGDNNSWLDSETPTREQLLGKLILRVPQGGVWLDRLTSPPALAAISFLLLASGGTTAALTRRQRRKKRTAVKPTPLPPALRQLPPALRTAATVVAAIAVASLTAGVLSWTRPLTSPASTPAQTESNATVTFSYEATVPQSAAYDDTTVTEPQPVFRKLADDVEVAFRYDSDVPVADATALATARLSTANGWQSTIPVGAPQTFTGPSFTGTAALDLSELQARADAAAKAIGDTPAGDVSVTVIAQVTTDNGTPFAAELPFTLSADALRLASADTELTVTHSGTTPAADGATQPATLTVLGRSILVEHARTAAAAGLALAILAGVILALLANRARRVPEPDAINLRYSELLLAVDPMALPTGRPVVEVPQIDALVRLAERYGLFVMHWDRGGRHTYVVLDDSTTYRYRTAPTTPPEPGATEQATLTSSRQEA